MRTSSLAVGAAAVAVAALGAVPAMADTPARSTPTTPMCATSQLTASLGGGDAGAGNRYRTLVLTNHSKTVCHLTGFPGVSMLDAAGKQIGSPATREPVAYSPVVLRPGGAASDGVHTASPQGPACLPTSAQLRVYPPGNRDSLVIAAKFTNCVNTFAITPLTAGDSGLPASPPPTASAAPTRSAPSGGGQQVPVVPSGAPDTGLAAAHTGGAHHDTAIVAGAAAGALLLGGLGAGTRRRRSRAQVRG